MQIKSEKRTSVHGRLVAAVCAIAVLSQLPFFVEHRITNMISIPIWLVLCLMIVMHNRGKISLTGLLTPLCLVTIWLVYYLLCCLFNSAYLQSDLPYTIGVSMFILIMGNMAGKYINRADLRLIRRSYIVSCVILAVVVYLEYFYEDVVVSPIYLYSEKNSTAQLLMTAIILIVTTPFEAKDTKRKLVAAVCAVILAAVLLQMKSRATMIFIPFMVVLLLISKSASKKLKGATVVVVIGVVLVLLWNKGLRDDLLYDIIYAGRDETDLNVLSSGRWEEWETFFSDWGDQWLFGHGKMKRESLILVSFLEYGIFFGGLILVLAAYPLYYGIVSMKKDNPYRLQFLCVAACYLSNGVFEQLAPFGPGVKCFMLWLLLGIFSCQQKKDVEELSAGDKGGNLCGEGRKCLEQ